MLTILIKISILIANVNTWNNEELFKRYGEIHNIIARFESIRVNGINPAPTIGIFDSLENLSLGDNYCY